MATPQDEQLELSASEDSEGKQPNHVRSVGQARPSVPGDYQGKDGQAANGNVEPTGCLTSDKHPMDGKKHLDGPSEAEGRLERSISEVRSSLDPFDDSGLGPESSRKKSFGSRKERGGSTPCIGECEEQPRECIPILTDEERMKMLRHMRPEVFGVPLGSRKNMRPRSAPNAVSSAPLSGRRKDAGVSAWERISRCDRLPIEQTRSPNDDSHVIRPMSTSDVRRRRSCPRGETTSTRSSCSYRRAPAPLDSIAFEVNMGMLDSLSSIATAACADGGRQAPFEVNQSMLTSFEGPKIALKPEHGRPQIREPRECFL